MPFTPEQERAQMIRDSFNVQARRITDNPRITDEAAERDVARLYLATETQLDALKEQQNGGTVERRTELEADLFGPIDPRAQQAVDGINYSDLNGAGTLLRLYERARHDHDDLIVRAAVSKAIELGATDVITRAITDGNPHAESVGELWRLITTDPINDPGNWSFDVPKPAVLNGYNPLQIRLIAERDDLTVSIAKA